MDNSGKLNSQKVSVVMPIYGRLGNVAALIQKLNAQTVKPHEIILVDSSQVELKEIPGGSR